MSRGVEKDQAPEPRLSRIKATTLDLWVFQMQGFLFYFMSSYFTVSLWSITGFGVRIPVWFWSWVFSFSFLPLCSGVSLFGHASCLLPWSTWTSPVLLPFVSMCSCMYVVPFSRTLLSLLPGPYLTRLIQLPADLTQTVLSVSPFLFSLVH